MANSLFSTYSNGENRVTSTILAVFERLNSQTVNKIFQILIEDSSFELIKYENQVKLKHSNSVPDARIKGLFDFLIETKTVRNGLDKNQIIRHTNSLQYPFSRLFLLTPDSRYPEVLHQLKKSEESIHKLIIWSNFDKLILGINSILEDTILLLDREKFLLLELKDFLINENLIEEDYSAKIVIVPAGQEAWNLYQEYGIYKCQPNRTFQRTSYMGFYAENHIQKYFPRILGYTNNLNIQQDDLNSVEFISINNTSKDDLHNRLISLRNTISNSDWNEKFKYIFLTDINDKSTIKNDSLIKNDKTSSTGKGTAYVQKQTYLNVDDLKNKKYTTELL